MKKKESREPASNGNGAQGEGAPPGHGLAIRYAHRAFVRCLWAQLGNEDLNGAHFLVLRTLWDVDGLTQTELSQRLAMDPPHVTVTLDQMARKGLIRRERHREDGRKVNVRLTAKSRAM